MCLDARALRSWYAVKGWDTRRARLKALTPSPQPYEGGEGNVRRRRAYILDAT